VVRDDDGLASMLGGEDGVLRGEDSLDDDREARRLVQPVEITPGQPWIDEQSRRGRRDHAQVAERRGVDLEPVLGLQRETCPEIAFTAAEHGQIDREDHGREPGLASLVEDRLRDAAVGVPVELKPAATLGRGSRHFGWTRRRKRREAHDRARGRRGACNGNLPFGMHHALVGDRCRDDRHRKLGAEHRRLRRHLCYVHKGARSEPPAPKRLEVASDRVLVAGTPGEVAEGGLVHDLLGDALVVPDVDRFLGELHLRRIWRS
jgi:hypothetical protein